MELGKELDKSDFLDMILPDEGELHMIYGKIGQGKTYYATKCILEDLERGQVVYTTFPLAFNGIDDRRNIKRLIFNRHLYRFDSSNLRYLDVYSDHIWDDLLKLGDCKIYFDDCIVHLFDSYEKTNFAKKKRQWAFETRHYDRTIVMVTQRPQQVQVALRSQVNRFFKCERLMKRPFLIFKVKEYQEMTGEQVNDNIEADGIQVFFGRKKIMQAYQTKYLRKDLPSIRPSFAVFSMSISERLRAVFSLVMEKLKILKKFFSFFLKKERKEIAIKSNSTSRGVKLIRVTLKKKFEGDPNRDFSEDEQNSLPF